MILSVWVVMDQGYRPVERVRIINLMEALIQMVMELQVMNYLSHQTKLNFS
jgi:hypothetical protein